MSLFSPLGKKKNQPKKATKNTEIRFQGTEKKNNPKTKKANKQNKHTIGTLKDNEVLKLITSGGCGISCPLIWRPKKRLEKYLIKDDLSDSSYLYTEE